MSFILHLSSSSVTFYNLFLKFWSTGNETGYPCHHLFLELLIRHKCHKVKVRISGLKHSELTFHLCTGEKTPSLFRLSSQLFSSATWKKSIPAPPVSVSSLRTVISVLATTSNQPTNTENHGITIKVQWGSRVRPALPWREWLCLEERHSEVHLSTERT